MYEDLSMPRSFSSLHATVLHSNVKDAHLTFRKERKKEKTIIFCSIFYFRTVQHYGKIWYQKPTKCIFNSSTFNIIMFRQPWKIVLNYRSRRVLCTRRSLYLPDRISRRSIWQRKKRYFELQTKLIFFCVYHLPWWVGSIIQWYTDTQSSSYSCTTSARKLVCLSCHNNFSSRH